METVNIHEAKTHLSRLLEKAVKGEPFIIAKAGKPMVRVVAVDAPEAKPVKRIGFLAGQIKVPDVDVWREMDQEIEKMFYGDDE